jgi:methionine-rich copper-binding protein CopC
MIHYCASPDKSWREAAGGEGAAAIAATRPSDAVVRSRMSATTRSQRPVAALAVLLGLCAATIALTPGIARSHAIIVTAQPGMNSTVPPGQLDIRLEFNSRIDSKRSNLRLQRPDGTESDVSLTPDSPRGVIAGRAQTSVNGRWNLRWQVLSLDGHITRGEVSFSVRDVARSR